MIDFQRFHQQLSRLLQDSKPGFAAQKKMSPVPKPGTKSFDHIHTDHTKAGVLILLYPVENKWHFVLTKRSKALARHAGQISLPGGRQEANEKIEQTAIREMYEELHVSSDMFSIAGQLTPLYIPRTHFCVYPLVACSHERLVLKPLPGEVKEIIEMPVKVICDPFYIKEELWSVNGDEMTVPFYHFQDYKIWGATTMILSELSEIVCQIFPN